MENIDISVDEEGIMTVRVDLRKDFGPSSSGKTNIIATTKGNQEVVDNVFVGINVYRKMKGGK